MFGMTWQVSKVYLAGGCLGIGSQPEQNVKICCSCLLVYVLVMRGCILVEVFGGPLPYDDCSNIQQIVAKATMQPRAFA